MPLGYRTILTADPTEENLDDLVGTFSKWVTTKKGFAELPTAGAVTHPSGATVTASTFVSADGLISAKRWTLVEEWDAPVWYKNTETPRTGVTNVTLALAERKLWFWVDVEPPTLIYPTRNDHLVEEVQFSGRPTFVRDILDSINMHDGAAEPISEFQIIASQTHVDELAKVLRDDERIGAVLVTAAPNDTDVNEWAALSTRRVGQIQGMGIGYVLTPEARALFNRIYGAAGHWVSPGALRTFLPGADLDDPQDSFNHKLLHASTLLDSNEKRIQRILRNAQLTRLAAIRIPDALREVDYELLRKERLQPFAILHEQPDGSVTAVEDVAVWIELAEQAENEVVKTLDENRALRHRASLSEGLLDVVQAESDENYEALARSRNQTTKLEREVLYLRRALTELGAEGAEAAWSFNDDESLDKHPETFAQLLDRVKGLSGVRFTGDIEDALELDEIGLLGEAVVMKTWDTILTFDAYSRARAAGDFDHSLSQYVKYTNHGLLMRAGKIVWSESETVKNNEKFRAQRMLPVDIAVDRSGFTLMVAHVKLSNLTGVAPRMYFEDTYSKVGYVTVGYLGAHMSNTLTN
jgi:hypothetical protein